MASMNRLKPAGPAVSQADLLRYLTLTLLDVHAVRLQSQVHQEHCLLSVHTIICARWAVPHGPVRTSLLIPSTCASCSLLWAFFSHKEGDQKRRLTSVLAALRGSDAPRLLALWDGSPKVDPRTDAAHDQSDLVLVRPAPWLESASSHPA